ncbi:MAG: serine acetyltransferase [Myxococcales bacterium]|nr:serine acetyltransferase [Myxococcales bacterium]
MVHHLYELLVDVLAAEHLAQPGRGHLAPGAAPVHARAEQLARCRAHETALSLIDELPGLRDMAETDLQAALDGDPAARSRAEVVLCYPGFHAVLSYRVAHLLWLAGAHLTARLMTELAHARTGIDLHPGATIGPAFFIDHGTGVVVGETAHVGRRVRLYQGVTLGARSVPKVRDGEPQPEPPAKRHPTLEDDVVVYANATLLGGDVVIGRGAIIGGNTWVTASVPPGARLRVDVAARVADAVVMVPDGAQPE